MSDLDLVRKLYAAFAEGDVPTFLGHRRKTGKPLDVQAAHTWWIEAGKGVRFQQMVDTAKMLAAMN